MSGAQTSSSSGSDSGLAEGPRRSRSCSELSVPSLDGGCARRPPALPSSSGSLMCQSYFLEDIEELLLLPSPNGAHDHQQERPTFTFDSGGTYTGQWCRNMRHGFGVQRWADGSVYEGEWRDNSAWGRGRFQHTGGNVYCGCWKSNNAHGVGIYRYTKQRQDMCYEGEWQDDAQHGCGVLTWEEGHRYEGEFVMGRKSGLGTYTWVDGSVYRGAWSDSVIDGPGSFDGADGREFRGQWQASEMHGTGVYSWPDGRVYSGQYRSDRKCGFGKFSWPEGKSFEGYWLDGRQHGHGIAHRHSAASRVAAFWVKGEMVGDADASSTCSDQDDSEDENMHFNFSRAVSIPPSSRRGFLRRLGAARQCRLPSPSCVRVLASPARGAQLARPDSNSPLAVI